METSIETADGLVLRGREWPLPKARGTIVLVHGLGEHVGRYGHVAGFLNEHGWRVLGFDQRGHGMSAGARGRLAHDDDLLVDLARVIDFAGLRGPGPLVLLGHSMGGLVAARFVAEAIAASSSAAAAWSRPVDALILSSPALDTGMTAAQKALLAVLSLFAPNLAVSNGLKAEWISRDPTVVAAYQADPLVHDRVTARLVRFIVDGGKVVLDAASGWTVPTLLLYAGSDRCVAPAGSAAFVAVASAKVVAAHVFPSLLHEIFNEPERAEVFSRLGAWLDTLPLFSNLRSPR